MTERAAAAKESASRAVHEAARKWSDTAVNVRARRGFDSMLNEQPLVLGAAGVALGAAIAAAVPRTRAEDEWLGEASDHLAHDLEAGGKDELGKVRETVAAGHGAGVEGSPATQVATPAPDSERRQTAQPSPAASPEVR